MEADDHNNRLPTLSDNSSTEQAADDERRRNSVVSTSMISDEPSIEQSKEWINTYLDGSAGKEDDFQRKFLEGGQRIDPITPATQAREILKEEMDHHPEDAGEKIIETYEEVLTATMLQSPVRKFTLDNIPCAECDENDSHIKLLRLSVPGSTNELPETNQKKENEIESIREKNNQSTNEEAVKHQQIAATPILEKTSAKNEQILPTSLAKTRSKSKPREKTPIKSFKQGESMAAPPSDTTSQIKADTMIKIKIFDLTLVHERYMNKTHDEVRNKFLKTLQVKQKMPAMFSPKPPVKEQKSRLLCNPVIIFDWDDTLFCTSFLSSLNHNRKSELGTKEKLLFKKVDESAVSYI